MKCPLKEKKAWRYTLVVIIHLLSLNQSYKKVLNGKMDRYKTAVPEITSFYSMQPSSVPGT